MIIKLSQILFLDDFVYLVESIQKDNKEDQFGSADVETIFVIVKGQTLIEKDDIGKVKCTMKFTSVIVIVMYEGWRKPSSI